MNGNASSTNGVYLSVVDAPNGSDQGAPARESQGLQSISADEIALYDRQIRLWGVQAQEKLRNANVLLIGIKALGNEIAKNLVLAGIGALTVVDDQVVTEDDLGAQFFISEKHVGMNRAQAALPEIEKLNPRVKVEAFSMPIIELLKNPLFFQPFTLIVATDLPIDVLKVLNSASRLAAHPFYAASTFGMYGYIFADLLTHTFVIEREKSNVATKAGPETTTRSVVGASTKKGDNGKTVELVTKTELYSPISQVITAPLPAFHVANRRRRLAVTPLLSCLRALWQYQNVTAKTFPSNSSHEDLALFTTMATEKHRELGLPPETLRADFLRSMLQNFGCELAPVCAFLGGQLAQDVINVVGGKEQPVQNLLLFDGEEGKGPVYAMHPPPPPLVDIPVDLAGNRGGVPVDDAMDNAMGTTTAI